MAIVIEKTITLKNNQATLDSPLYLYVGDGDITYLFTIKEMKKAATFGSINQINLITEQASYGEVRIYKPDGELVFTTRAEIIDNKLQALFSYEHIDQLTEAGVHQLQIHLYDDDNSERNRFTIPPVELNVLFPVGTSSNLADAAIVGQAEAVVANEVIDTFVDGSYNKTEWTTGDKITSSKLNKIEDAIYQINASNGDYVTNEELDAKNYLTEHQSLDNYATKTYVNSSMDLKLIDYAKKTDMPSLDGLVSSNSITRIEVVRYLPEIEVDGVLYIVTEEEE